MDDAFFYIMLPIHYTVSNSLKYLW